MFNYRHSIAKMNQALSNIGSKYKIDDYTVEKYVGKRIEKVKVYHIKKDMGVGQCDIPTKIIFYEKNKLAEFLNRTIENGSDDEIELINSYALLRQILA